MLNIVNRGLSFDSAVDTAQSPCVSFQQAFLRELACSPTSFAPCHVIDHMGFAFPEIGDCFRKTSHGWEGYSNGEHALMVVGGFYRHIIEAYSQSKLATIFRPGIMAVYNALHDVGKGVAESSKEQYPHNFRIISGLLSQPAIEVTEIERRIILHLAKADLLAEYLLKCAHNDTIPTYNIAYELARKMIDGTLGVEEIRSFGSKFRMKDDTEIRRIARSTVQALNQAAAEIGINPVDLLDIRILCYFCDLSAYTVGSLREEARSRGIEPREIVIPADKRAGLKRAFPVFDYCIEVSPSFTFDLRVEAQPAFDIRRAPAMFVFDHEPGRPRFSEEIERALAILRRELSN